MTVRDDQAPPRPGTVHPRLARERALKLLFQADVRGEDPRVVLDRVETTSGALQLLDELEPAQEEVAADDELRAELRRRRRLPLDDYTRLLVRGVARHRPSIDRLLEDVAERWTVARMPGVDRNLLRLAVYELVVQDTPPAVVIDEAVSLARGFAGERARPFVNGVLETVRRRVAAGEVQLVEVEGQPVAGADAATVVSARGGDGPGGLSSTRDVARDAPASVRDADEPDDRGAGRDVTAPADGAAPSTPPPEATPGARGRASPPRTPPGTPPPPPARSPAPTHTPVSAGERSPSPAAQGAPRTAQEDRTPPRTPDEGPPDEAPPTAADARAWDEALDLLAAVEDEEHVEGDEHAEDGEDDVHALDVLDAPDTVALDEQTGGSADQLDLFGDDAHTDGHHRPDDEPDDAADDGPATPGA